MIFCKQTIAYWWTIVKSHWFIFNVLHGSIYKKNKIVGELLRNTHSIEKGMSLENVRLGFGTLKILAALRLVEEYLKYGELTDEPVMMFLDALDSYLRFHEERNFCNSTIENIRGRALELNEKRKKSPQDSSIVYGGTIMVEHQYYTDQEQTFFSKLFYNRHSVRDFADGAVDIEALRKAIELALHCPSACNRQGFGLYIVNKKDFNLLDGCFDGIGGFTDKIDKILFITGKISAYRQSEMHQWIVSSSIFAAYLSLTLEVYNIGACFIQRQLLYNSKRQKSYDKIGIAHDEQVICCLGIGNLKRSYAVPVSHRMKPETIIHNVNVNK